MSKQPIPAAALLALNMTPREFRALDQFSPIPYEVQLAALRAGRSATSPLLEFAIQRKAGE